ncbi:hypothetical protein ACTI_19420 [Actinoplanes sp. OR16]|uniref:iron chaperone n=1 Tax=Actinoplanes sp. OR16 TaxID=946334 RepID=UPI000F6D4298|nr:DUF1801 domain-containing protein [Actinoplanes sp. OR16]BBH65257.1 hypothetical protein ACTI_19420 [Actinoplanes sp. OR16]
MTAKTYDGFTDAERDAMKQRAKELKGRRGDAEPEVLAKIADMAEFDRVIGQRLHELIKEHAPEMTSKLWYGMPSYARNGKTVCFFQPSTKFKTRYAILGFSDEARLDDGTVWPTYFAISALDDAAESTIVALIKQALS